MNRIRKNMNGLKTSLACAIIACALVLPSFAVVNPGFESGDSTGWTDNGGPTAVVNTYTEPDGPGQVYSPAYGSYFAVLTSGLTDEVGDPIYSTLSQTFSLDANDVISGSAAFDAGDFYFDVYNDDAYVQIQGPAGTFFLWTKDVEDVGDYGSSNWEIWNYTAPISGTYTLVYAVRNAGDNASDSKALFDAPQISQISVPDSGSTLLLLGASMMVLVGFGRRKQNA